MHAKEAFFFNLLSDKKPVRTNQQLLSPRVESYFVQCIIDGLIPEDNPEEVRRCLSAVLTVDVVLEYYPQDSAGDFAQEAETMHLIIC